MAAPVDPYYEWLGIPPKHQPANHYRLLGLDPFEENPNVISAAADRQMSFVRQYQTVTDLAEVSQRLLNELSAARLCLLKPAQKAEYDRKLRAERGDGAPPPPPLHGTAPLQEPCVATRPVAEPPVASAPGRPAVAIVFKERERRRRAPSHLAGRVIAVVTAAVIAVAVTVWAVVASRPHRSTADRSPGTEEARPAGSHGAAKHPAAVATEEPPDEKAAAEPTNPPANTDHTPPSPAAPESSSAAVAGWRATSPKGKLTSRKGVLILEGTGATAADVPAVSGDVQIELRVRHQSGGKARLLWTEKEAPTFDLIRSTDVEIGAGGEWHVAKGTLEVRGSLTGLRIDPPSGDGPLTLDWVHVRTSDGKLVKEWGFGGVPGSGRSTKASRDGPRKK